MKAQPNPKYNADINDTYGEAISPSELRIVRLMPASPERVWAYLTESEKSKQWLAQIDSEVKVGQPYKKVFNHENITDEATPEEFKAHKGHSTKGEVLIYDPYNTFSYTWIMSETPTEVVFELQPQGENTLLTLTHRKLPARDNMLSVGPGWHAHLDVLITKLAKDAPKPFWANFMKLKTSYEEIL